MKIKATTAAEVCAQFDLPRKARALLRPGIAPLDFMNALLAHQEHKAGIDFLDRYPAKTPVESTLPTARLKVTREIFPVTLCAALSLPARGEFGLSLSLSKRARRVLSFASSI